MGLGRERTVQDSMAKQEGGFKPVPVCFASWRGIAVHLPTLHWLKQSRDDSKQHCHPGAAVRSRERAEHSRHSTSPTAEGWDSAEGSGQGPAEEPLLQTAPSSTAPSADYCYLGGDGKHWACGLCPKEDCRHCVLVVPGAPVLWNTPRIFPDNINKRVIWQTVTSANTCEWKHPESTALEIKCPKAQKYRECPNGSTFVLPASSLPATPSRPQCQSPTERRALSQMPSAQKAWKREGAEWWLCTARSCQGQAEWGTAQTYWPALHCALLKLPSHFPAGTSGRLHQSINMEQRVLINCTFVWFKTQSLYSLKLPCTAFTGASAAW